MSRNTTYKVGAKFRHISDGIQALRASLELNADHKQLPFGVAAPKQHGGRMASYQKEHRDSVEVQSNRINANRGVSE